MAKYNSKYTTGASVDAALDAGKYAKGVLDGSTISYQNTIDKSSKSTQVYLASSKSVTSPTLVYNSAYYYLDVAWYPLVKGRKYVITIPQNFNKYSYEYVFTDTKCAVDAPSENIELGGVFGSVGKDIPETNKEIIIESYDKDYKYIAVCYNGTKGEPTVIEYYSVSSNSLISDVNAIKSSVASVESSVSAISSKDVMNIQLPLYGKKFYTIGDSITMAGKYQPHIVSALGVSYDSTSTKDADYPNDDFPLGWGGGVTMPFVNVYKDDDNNKSTTRPVLDRDGNQVSIGGNNKYYVIGQEYLHSAYNRADGFAQKYSNANVIFMLIGTNDQNYFKNSKNVCPINYSYFNLGTKTDAPYEGNYQFVRSRDAWLSNYLDNIAIVNDGEADLTDYADKTIVETSDVPTYASVYIGLIKKIMTSCKGAKFVASTMLRNSTDINVGNGSSARTNLANLQAEILKYYNVPFVDLWNDMSYNKFNYTTYLKDGVHPTDLGYFWMAKAIILKM